MTGTNRWKGPNPGQTSSSGRLEKVPLQDQMLETDAVDVWLQRQSAGDAPSPLVEALRAHPCRKCPHLALSHDRRTTDASLALEPARPEFFQTHPVCLLAGMYVQTEHGNYAMDSKGQPRLIHRITWKRCPLYGVRDVLTMIQDLTLRVAALEARLLVPRTRSEGPQDR